ncbi:MAG: hypothetical protein J6S67_11730 [Methanobrevibacter sp.]|nr:hypothetical protein [Methanobrevibacter sp.]
MEQYEWAENGNIRPCPYKDNCRTYMIGCDGQSYWCNNGEVMRKEANNETDN